MRIMKHCSLLVVSLAFCYSVGVCAQEEKGDDSLDLTMKLLPEDAKTPEPITRHIELPVPPASSDKSQSRSDAAPPIEGVGQGRDTASEAQERGREFGQDVAQQARDNRENVGRDRTAGPPDSAGPGANPPGPPITPPGQSQ